MGDLEETNQVEEVITKETTKAVEHVGDKIEEFLEKAGVDSSLVEPLIEQAAAVVATVVSEGATVIAEKLGLTLISESSLTEDQKKLASSIYDSVKGAVGSFVIDPTVNNILKITKTLGQVIKKLESATVDGKTITGEDKKAVAIQLGRILLKEVIPDDKGEDELLVVYDLVAEATLEAMIDVSKVVNTAVQEAATKCCPGLLEFFKRSKASK